MGLAYAGRISLLQLPIAGLGPDTPVLVLQPGTNELVALYTDRTKSHAAPNPTTALVLSTGSIFGDPGDVDLCVAEVRFPVTIPADPADVASGGGLPSWLMSGSGTPVNVVTPSQQGALYQDTTNGTLYEAIGASSDQWVALGGDGVTPLAKGIQQRGTGLYMVAIQNAWVTDAQFDPGIGNALVFHGAMDSADDGFQYLLLQLGSSGQFTWRWNADGSSQFPGPLKMANGNSLYNTAAVPDNAVGADGDWSFGADGHIYARSGGAWSLKI